MGNRDQTACEPGLPGTPSGPGFLPCAVMVVLSDVPIVVVVSTGVRATVSAAARQLHDGRFRRWGRLFHESTVENGRCTAAGFFCSAAVAITGLFLRYLHRFCSHGERAPGLFRGAPARPVAAATTLRSSLFAPSSACIALSGLRESSVPRGHSCGTPNPGPIAGAAMRQVPRSAANRSETGNQCPLPLLTVRKTAMEVAIMATMAEIVKLSTIIRIHL